MKNLDLTLDACITVDWYPSDTSKISGFARQINSGQREIEPSLGDCMPKITVGALGEAIREFNTRRDADNECVISSAYVAKSNNIRHRCGEDFDELQLKNRHIYRFTDECNASSQKVYRRIIMGLA